MERDKEPAFCDIVGYFSRGGHHAAAGNDLDGVAVGNLSWYLIFFETTDWKYTLGVSTVSDLSQNLLSPIS